MQTVILVACARAGSLRESIVKDRRLADWRLKVSQEKVKGRNPGWAKLRSTHAGIPGALNISREPATGLLVARAITKGGNWPSDLIDDFLSYLVERYKQRITSVTIMPW